MTSFKTLLYALCLSIAGTACTPTIDLGPAPDAGSRSDASARVNATWTDPRFVPDLGPTSAMGRPTLVTATDGTFALLRIGAHPNLPVGQPQCEIHATRYSADGRPLDAHPFAFGSFLCTAPYSVSGAADRAGTFHIAIASALTVPGASGTPVEYEIRLFELRADGFVPSRLGRVIRTDSGYDLAVQALVVGESLVVLREHRAGGAFDTSRVGNAYAENLGARGEGGRIVGVWATPGPAVAATQRVRRFAAATARGKLYVATTNISATEITVGEFDVSGHGTAPSRSMTIATTPVSGALRTVARGSDLYFAWIASETPRVAVVDSEALTLVSETALASVPTYVEDLSLAAAPNPDGVWFMPRMLGLDHLASVSRDGAVSSPELSEVSEREYAAELAASPGRITIATLDTAELDPNENPRGDSGTLLLRQVVGDTAARTLDSSIASRAQGAPTVVRSGDTLLVAFLELDGLLPQKVSLVRARMDGTWLDTTPASIVCASYGPFSVASTSNGFLVSCVNGLWHVGKTGAPRKIVDAIDDGRPRDVREVPTSPIAVANENVLFAGPCEAEAGLGYAMCASVERVDPSGAGSWVARRVRISASRPTTAGLTPTVTSDGEKFFIAWSQDGDIHLSVLDAQGRPLVTDHVVSEANPHVEFESPYISISGNRLLIAASGTDPEDRTRTESDGYIIELDRGALTPTLPWKRLGSERGAISEIQAARGDGHTLAIFGQYETQDGETVPTLVVQARGVGQMAQLGATTEIGRYLESFDLVSLGEDRFAVVVLVPDLERRASRVALRFVQLREAPF